MNYLSKQDKLKRIFDIYQMNDKEFKEEFAKHIRKTQPTHWLTLHWHRSAVPMDQMLKDLSRLHRDVDYARLGSHYNRAKNAEHRSKALFLIEKMHVSTHVHSFWKVETEVDSFEALLKGENPPLWTNIAPGGSAHLVRYDPNKGAVEYSLKEFGLETGAECFVLAEKFYSKNK